MLKKLFGFFNGKFKSDPDFYEGCFEFDEDQFYESTEEEFDYEYMYYMH
ncbi:hypothetical protein J6TS1_10540 [Siminovitchia terrae]|uniref:Phage protein n=1 Tax=Siminovitchia terrae TaxID=1914933 RepID=A0ABQ4KU70_SIMTE|nr:hypothetical protein [Siminovitchia terrae]GIN89115.1 hypothetical protein J22TS1_01660 [Siminovitchia terrae]GIN95184.1 hypothetical protein J6TS1_10540 [Siminovitchia terrae]